MDVLQLIGALVGAIVVLVGAVKLSNRQTNKAMDGERAARIALEKQLRRELKDGADELEKARNRIRDLVAERQRDKNELTATKEELEAVKNDLGGQLKTLLIEMALLQEQVQQLKTDLDAERDRNSDLEAKNEAQAQTIRERDATITALENQIVGYQDALRIVQGQLKPEPGEHKPDCIESTESESQERKTS